MESKKYSKKVQLARSYNLDIPSYVSIEYPLRVKNRDKAIDMVGGTDQISKCFIEPDMILQLKLRPEDPYSHPVDAVRILSSENVLLKIAIPKRVLLRNNRNIQKSLQDCEENNIKYKIEPQGVLSQTHKFRDLADFQVIRPHSEFINKFQNSIAKGDLDQIKSFANYIQNDFNEKQSFSNVDMDLPPLMRYARSNVPYNYRYSGNLLVDEQGYFKNKRVRLHTIFREWGDSAPTAYDPSLDEDLKKAENEVESLTKSGLARLLPQSPAYCLITCINLVKKLFEMKPIWIRRHIHWILPKEFRSQLRFSLPFVAYTTKKGPWRQSFIKLGYDPVTDPKAVKYQVEGFRASSKHITDLQIEKMIQDGEDQFVIPKTLYPFINDFSDSNSELNKLNIGKVPRQFLFDGENATTAVSFQLGDLMDEDVVKLLESAKITETCTELSGWYEDDTIYKMRAVIKYKLDCIKRGKPIDNQRVSQLLKRSKQQLSRRGDDEDQEGEEEIQEDDEDDREIVDEDEEEEEDDDDDDDEDDDDDGDDDDEDDDEDVYDEPEKQDSDVEMEDPDNPNSKANQNNVKVHDGLEIPDTDIFKRLKAFNPESSNILEDLDGFLQQQDLMLLRKAGSI